MGTLYLPMLLRLAQLLTWIPLPMLLYCTVGYKSGYDKNGYDYTGYNKDGAPSCAFMRL
jgi:hypothetical protein